MKSKKLLRAEIFTLLFSIRAAFTFSFLTLPDKKDVSSSLLSRTRLLFSDSMENNGVVTRPYEKTVSGIRRRTFSSMYPRLVAFQEKFGHTHVREEDDPELYRWTKNLRYNYLWQIRNYPDPARKRKKLSEEKLQLLRDINFSWETSRDWQRWPTMLANLRDYKQDYGTTYVDPSIDHDLYTWTKNIRLNYRHQVGKQTNLDNRKSKRRRPRLAASKMKALEEMGFEWGNQERQEYLKWEDMIVRLVAFYTKHGHTNVPNDYEDYDLYRWCRSIRTNYGHQLTNTTTSSNQHFLPADRLEKLRSIGFDCQIRSTMWERKFKELEEFWKRNGHCRVTPLENSKLYNFVQNQKKEYRYYVSGNASSLTRERVDALKKLNFEWSESHDVVWNKRYKELQAHFEVTGTTSIPQNYAANYQLGQWVMNQRVKYKRRKQGFSDSMTDERIAALRKLDFEWSIKEMRWKIMFDRFKAYQKENGHLEIPTSDIMNDDLRQWVNAQRYFYRTQNYSRLTEERIRLMETIPGFEWRRQLRTGPSKEDWKDLFGEIRKIGIAPGAKVKEHIFDGLDRWANVKTEYSEEELVALWNEEEDEDDEQDEYFEEDTDEYFEDDESRMFLRA